MALYGRIEVTVAVLSVFTFFTCGVLFLLLSPSQSKRLERALERTGAAAMVAFVLDILQGILVGIWT